MAEVPWEQARALGVALGDGTKHHVGDAVGHLVVGVDDGSGREAVAGVEAGRALSCTSSVSLLRSVLTRTGGVLPKTLFDFACFVSEVALSSCWHHKTYATTFHFFPNAHVKNQVSCYEPFRHPH